MGFLSCGFFVMWCFCRYPRSVCDWDNLFDQFAQAFQKCQTYRQQVKSNVLSVGPSSERKLVSLLCPRSTLRLVFDKLHHTTINTYKFNVGKSIFTKYLKKNTNCY